MSTPYSQTTLPHRVLEEKYFYPVKISQPGLRAFVGTDRLVPTNKTPEQLIMDRDTCVVYLVDANGMLYMQPAECFPREILNAPLWKTIPLPKEEFRRSYAQQPTPPTTPPSSSSNVISGSSSSSLAYTGKESVYWAQQRVRRDSADVYPYPSSSSAPAAHAAVYPQHHQQQQQLQYMSQSYPPSSTAANAGFYARAQYPQQHQQRQQQPPVKQVRFA